MAKPQNLCLTTSSANPEDTEQGDGSGRTPLLSGMSTPAGSTTRARSRAQRNPEADDEDYLSSDATTPLIDPDSTQDDQDEEEEEEEEDQAKNKLRALLRPRVLFLAILLTFVLELANGMTTAPANALMESIICRQLHPEVFSPPLPVVEARGVDIGVDPAGLDDGARQHQHRRTFAGGIVMTDDPKCKQPDVQGYLAMMRGGTMVLDSLTGVVGALPYGIMSDRRGRKPVLGLSLLGIALTASATYIVYFFSNVVPLWLSLFASLFQFIGGGGIVFVAMIYTTIADVVHASERATLFLQLTAVFLGSEMLAGPLGGAMLLWSPWFPLLTSLGLILVGNLILTVFPETVHVHDGKKPGFRPGYSDDLDDDARDSGSSGHAGTRTAALRRGFRQARSGLAELWQFVVRNRRVASLVVALTFVILGRFVGELMLQYSTARYGWSWSHAAAVLTVRNAGCLVALLVVFPLGGRVLVRRFGLTASAKDLWLGRVSGVVLILGSLTIGAAAVGSMFVLGLVEFALGSGMSALVRSLLNSLVEEHHVGTVNSLVGFAEVVGMIIAGPLLAKSLSVGLQLGGAWIGLPFAVAALLFVVPTVILFTFRLPEGRRSSLTSVAGHHA